MFDPEHLSEDGLFSERVKLHFTLGLMEKGYADSGERDFIRALLSLDCQEGHLVTMGEADGYLEELVDPYWDYEMYFYCR